MSPATDPSDHTNPLALSSNATNITNTALGRIVVETLPTLSGHLLGIITVVDPKSLNSIGTQMCKGVATQLQAWQNDNSVVAVVLKGSGDRAFCAGGNIRDLYNSMTKYPANSCVLNLETEDFFANEYHTHFCMHRFNKPIIAWGSGIVMGGGMGLLNASSHRVISETTRFAMPEISIGLIPDACGSWFLQRMPAKSGLFLGLTASHGNGGDALFTNIADYALASDELELLINTLTKADWQLYEPALHSSSSKNTDNKHNKNHDVVSHALADIHHSEHLPSSQFLEHWQTIQELCNKGSIHDIDKALRSEELARKYANNKWMTTAINNYKAGCPATAAVTFEIFQRAKTLSVEQVLDMELTVVLHRANYPDFREGVRALLIDKDKSPQWSRTLDDCDADFIHSHFVSPYTDSHPFDKWLV